MRNRAITVVAPFTRSRSPETAGAPLRPRRAYDCRMATWRDGPEYAPVERPAAFVTPEAEPLPGTTPPPALPDGVPGEEPSFTAPSGDLPDLAALVPSAAPGRNPNLPFEVVAAIVTGGANGTTGPASGGQAVPERRPELPFRDPGPSLSGYLPVQPTLQPHAQVNPVGFPAPGTPQWFAPPPGSRVPDAPPPVTIAQIWTAVTPGVLIPLLLGMFLPWLSLFMLAISFALSARIAYRKDAVRRTYVIALTVLAAVGINSLLTDNFNSDLLFEALSGGAQLASVVLPVALGLIVGAALRAGERPDHS